jgi:hypothetical protein
MKINLFNYIIDFIIILSTNLEAKIKKVSFIFDDTHKSHYTLLSYYE